MRYSCNVLNRVRSASASVSNEVNIDGSKTSRV